MSTTYTTSDLRTLIDSLLRRSSDGICDPDCPSMKPFATLLNCECGSANVCGSDLIELITEFLRHICNREADERKVK